MITDVPGVLVGHHTDLAGATGCTVVLLPEGTVASYAVVGAAPDTRQTELLAPQNLVREVHAILLCGGSAFGLGAADGVMEWLDRRGAGFPIGTTRVPIVPTAVLFDLSVGDPRARPRPEDAYAACEAATAAVEEGSVGAGTGATVGKWAGLESATKGGVGTASRRVAGAVVGALVACNAVGDVLDEEGRVLAGARVAGDAPWAAPPGASTVLVVVATTARLDKAACAHLARMAAGGVARAVRPAHTFYDGDVVFAAATGAVEVEPVLVGAAAAEAVAEAVRRSVRAARGLGGVPGLAG